MPLPSIRHFLFTRHAARWSLLSLARRGGGLGWLVGLCTSCAHGPHAPTRPLRAALGMAVQGRHVVEVGAIDADAARPAVRLGYSNSSLAFSFEGTALELCLQSLPGPDAGAGTDWFELELDGTRLPPVAAAHDQACAPLVRGLGAGRHAARLVKRTEALVGEVRAWWPRSQAAAPLGPRPHRKILAVGDSISCGYGNLCTGPARRFDPREEDATRSYLAQTARALVAELEVVALSGRGIARNRDGTTDGLLGSALARALLSTPSEAPPPALADVVVVNVGTNDLATVHSAAERARFDAAAFAAAYERLLAATDRASPAAHTVLCTGPMLSDHTPAGAEQLRTVREVVDGLAARRASQGRPTSVLHFTPQDDPSMAAYGLGCDHHPSEATHQLLAAHLTDVIRAAKRW